MIGAERYFECSARTGEGVQEVFNYAAHTALLHKKKRLGSASFCSQDVRSVLCHDKQYEGKSYRGNTSTTGLEAGNIVDHFAEHLRQPIFV